MLTLAEALLQNKQLIKTNQMDPRTIRSWYAKGYYVKADGLWYMQAGNQEYRKYYTGS